MAARTDTPKISVNLDTLEREGAPEEFAAVIGGKRIVMIDPQEIDWKDLLTIERPGQFLHHAFSDADRAHVEKQNFPGWKLNALMEAYTSHFGLGESGEGSASPLS